MNFNLHPKHELLLIIFGELSGAVMLLLFGFFWPNDFSTPISNTVILTPELQAELWKPVQADETTINASSSDLKKAREPVKGGKTISADEEADLFKPVQADNN